MEAPSRRSAGEASVPAQHPQAEEEARVPSSHADPGGTGRDHQPEAQGPRTPERLIWRVRDRETFRALARGRRRRRGPVSLAAVRYDDERRADPPRVAYRVGGRVGNAVVRNRIRRRLRAAVRANRSRMVEGRAYLVGAGRGAARVPDRELTAALGALLGDVERDERVIRRHGEGRRS